MVARLSGTSRLFAGVLLSDMYRSRLVVQAGVTSIYAVSPGCHGATTRTSHRLPRGLMAWPSCAPGSPFPICSFPASPGSLGSFVCVRYASRSALVPCCMVAGADLRRCGVSRSPRPPIRIVIHGPLALHIARQPAHSPCWRGCLRAAVLLPHIQTPSPASATAACQIMSALALGPVGESDEFIVHLITSHSGTTSGIFFAPLK
jgi:hypothetical protein